MNNGLIVQPEIKRYLQLITLDGKWSYDDLRKAIVGLDIARRKLRGPKKKISRFELNEG